MNKEELVKSPQWQFILKYLLQREQDHKQSLTGLLQTKLDTVQIRGRIQQIRDLVQWVNTAERGEEDAD